MGVRIPRPPPLYSRSCGSWLNGGRRAKPLDCARTLLNRSASLREVAPEHAGMNEAGMNEAGGLPLGIVDGLDIADDRVVTIAHDGPLRGLVGFRSRMRSDV